MSRCISSLRAGDDIATEVAELRRCVTAGAIDLQRLGKTLQDSLDCAATIEIISLEKSSIPDLQQMQKRQCVKVRMELYRINKKRMALDGVYDDSGEAILEPIAVGAAIAAEWAPTFAARPVDESDLQWFSQHVQR